MKKFVDITDRESLDHCLSKLEINTVPLWGTLTPISLVEHLITTLEYTNGKKVATCTLTAEQIEKRKQVVIYSDAELPMGIKTPVSKDVPSATTFKTVPGAMAALNKELDAFEKYFEAEGITSVHPGFGELNYNEWLIFHGKHLHIILSSLGCGFNI